MSAGCELRPVASWLRRGDIPFVARDVHVDKYLQAVQYRSAT